MSGFVDALYCTKTYSHETNPTGASYTLIPLRDQGLKRNQDSNIPPPPLGGEGEIIFSSLLQKTSSSLNHLSFELIKSLAQYSSLD